MKTFSFDLLLSVLVFFTACTANQETEIFLSHLTCEQAINPLGIETPSPSLGWQITSEGREIRQKAYRILVSDHPDTLKRDNGNYWDSGTQYSDNSLQVFYAGRKLQPAGTYYWKAKVWDKNGNESPWSDISTWQMGLTDAAGWKGAQWIALQELPKEKKVVPGIHGRGSNALGNMEDLLPLFRKDFKVEKTLRKATAFISGLGHFEMNLNGKKVGDHFLDPGWTSYEQYALYVTFDITSYLQQGENVCGIMLGNGFYHTPRERYLKCVVSHGYPKAICRLLMEYTDGTSSEVITDASWKATSSPITFSSIYGGEDYDARLERKGWDMPGYDACKWQQALIVEGPPLQPQTATPLKVMDTIAPVRVFRSKKGDWIYDLGQNASGIIRLSIKGKEGKQIKIWPGELLDDDSIVTQRASGSPFWFGYTTAGNGTEVWQPRFTYYGFRYLMLEGAVPEGSENSGQLPVVTGICGLHTRNSAPQTGTFTCSNDLFNRIFRLIDWSVRSNMASVLTDCPHREKLGWLEVAHLMGSSIQYNYNINRMYHKIIDDMRASQLPNGLVPDIAPEIVVFAGGFRDSPEWGSAYVILPWYLYQWYGDQRPMRKNYEGMKRYINYLGSTADQHIVSHGLGDWFDLGPKSPGESQLTSKGVTATAIYYYNVCIMQKTARILGYQEDEAHFTQLGKEIKSAFNQRFFNTETKQYDQGSQTANAMAIYMDLVEPQYRKDVFLNIMNDLKERNYSQTPGDIGFRYFLRVLESEGASETIYTINHREDVPGYGFQLAKGATALTESWAALRYVSNNHCMLGHLMEWFYSGIAGIRQSENSVAFKEIVIRPEPVGDLTSASATFMSPYGKIASEWKKENGKFYLDVEIPANTSALVHFPLGNIKRLKENGQAFRSRIIKDTKGHKAIRIGSGKYNFSIE
ncbi:MAG: glycoside hydrolase family 78 protein [Bacteroidales bacterium]|nr:glycoside hydrolase family 78 protein [Bacteroidales bacterium]